MLYKEQTKIKKTIELGSYNYSLKEAYQDNIPIDWNNDTFLNIYNTNMYELFINLNNSFINNHFLLTIIFDKKYASYDIIKLNELGEDNFCPELSIPIKEQIKKRAKVKINKKISKTYKCPKCEQYKVNVKSVQKRSLDENASEEILCLECGYFWINM